MGLSNKIIFPAGYNKIKEFEVETNIGNFKCVLLKERCMNRFRINAKQISVKYDGKNYFVSNNLETFTTMNYNLNPDIMDFSQETVVLERHNYMFPLRSHLILNREIEHFKADLIRKVS